MANRNNKAARSDQPTRTGLSNAALGGLVALVPIGIFVGYFLLNM